MISRISCSKSILVNTSAAFSCWTSGQSHLKSGSSLTQSAAICPVRVLTSHVLYTGIQYWIRTFLDMRILPFISITSMYIQHCMQSHIRDFYFDKQYFHHRREAEQLIRHIRQCRHKCTSHQLQGSRNWHNSSFQNIYPFQNIRLHQYRNHFYQLRCRM